MGQGWVPTEIWLGSQTRRGVLTWRCVSANEWRERLFLSVLVIQMLWKAVCPYACGVHLLAALLQR